MPKKIWIVIGIGLLMIVLKANAQSIDLYTEEKKIYPISENRLYDLKVKLKPKVSEPRDFSQEIPKQSNEFNSPLVKIDQQVFRLNDFELPKNFEDLERDVLVKRIELAKGKHKYEKLENPTFEVEWVILEPVSSIQPLSINEPEITFKKINPTKYLVKVERATEPLWLVFSESFHKQWKLYRAIQNISAPEFEEIVADYPKLKVKEARHLMKFTPQDIRFLFEKPLEAPHHLVNGYANGWYIEPEKLGLGENFVLAIYFWPQSLFYLGLGISGITFLGCIIFLLVNFLKNKICSKIKN
ncbi:MAG: hypothetical protein NC818_01420 [Candidatus Omnitrophica bacterium]|nr:hypothetical protein [Candidatus Omnitrophota bacterium]